MPMRPFLVLISLPQSSRISAVVSKFPRGHSNERVRWTTRSFPSVFRTYATHTERPFTPPSHGASGGSSSNTSSRAAQEIFAKLDAEALRKQPLGQETVGPFPLGVGPGGRSRAWKRWNELGLGGKIWRTTQQTGNITVIALGFGLFAILAFALTTELFAKNSPSVLYSQAVDLIRASNALNPHLLPPLTFTHSPQSSAPVRGSPPLAHRIIRHPHSGRDHLLLTFFVHGRGKDEPETLGWARRWYALAEGYARQAALNLGIVNSPEEEKEILPEIKTVPEKGLNLGNMFGGLSLKPVKVERRQKGTVPPGTYKIGEVRADYVKNASGQFTLLSLVIDIPSSRATHPSRAVVFWSPEADTEGLLGRRA